MLIYNIYKKLNWLFLLFLCFTSAAPYTIYNMFNHLPLENVFIETEPKIIYTRYLYVYKEVEQSFIESIAEKNANEALFWGYEMYDSGFEEETINLVMKIQKDHYSNFPNLGAFLLKQLNKYNDDIMPYADARVIFGIMVYNLANRRDKDRKFYVLLKDDDIQKYNQIETSEEMPPYKVLKTAAKYQIRPTNRQISKAELLDIYHDKWLYYAAYCPLWKARLDLYNGTKNHITKHIDFDSDENLEAFFEEYGYEPDEQTIDVQKQSVGLH